MAVASVCAFNASTLPRVPPLRSLALRHAFMAGLLHDVTQQTGGTCSFTTVAAAAAARPSEARARKHTLTVVCTAAEHMGDAAAAAEDAAVAAAWSWWCNTTVDEATGGVLGVVDRCYWIAGTTITELAAGAATHCPEFSLASPLDVLLVVALHFQWWVGLCLAFLQWYGVGAPASTYYRVAVGGGSLVNLGLNWLLARFTMPQAAPYWPTCGTAYALPSFATQSVYFYVVLLGVETARARGCSTYQLSVAAAVAYAVTLARVALGYNTPLQALAGAAVGTAAALVVDLATLALLEALAPVVAHWRAAAAATKSREPTARSRPDDDDAKKTP